MSPRSLATLHFTNHQLAAAPSLPTSAHFLYGAVIYPAADVLTAVTATETSHTPSVDWTAAQHVPGVVKCVQRHHFLAVVAVQQHAAYQARDKVEVDWGHTIAASTWSYQDTYSWDSSVDNTAAWAVAHYVDQQLHLWLSTAYPRQLQSEIAVVTGLSPEHIHLYQSTTPLTESYDVAVEAALLALEVDRPVYRQAQSPLFQLTLELINLADEVVMFIFVLLSIGIAVLGKELLLRGEVCSCVLMQPGNDFAQSVFAFALKHGVV